MSTMPPPPPSSSSKAPVFVKKQRRRPPVLGIIFGLVALLALLGATAATVFFYARSELGPVSSTSSGDVTVTVRAGETVADLAAALQSDNLIRSTFWFDQYARLKGLQDKLRAGQYTLNDAMSVSEIDNRLVQPPDRSIVTVTIPEGLTARQIAALLQQKTGIASTDYLKEETTGSFTEPFLASRPAGYPLEGFLFPDTYDVVQGASAHDVVQLQLDAFAAKAWPVLQGALPQHCGSGQQPCTVFDALTVASIVEREAKLPADRPNVASVIYNRLAAQMKLQVDPAVLYGAGKAGSGQQLTAQDLQTDTPWNTYTRAGLPMTPISNPGVASITAAVRPAQTQFIFYINDCSGAVHLSVTEAQHEQQIAQYLSKPC